MIQQEIVYLILIIAAVLITVGYVYRQQALYFSIGGSVLLVILGLILFTTPLVFISGSETQYNYTTDTATNTITYQEQNDTLTNTLTWVITLAGLTVLTMSSISMWEYKTKRNNEEY